MVHLPLLVWIAREIVPVARVGVRNTPEMVTSVPQTIVNLPSTTQKKVGGSNPIVSETVLPSLQVAPLRETVLGTTDSPFAPVRKTRVPPVNVPWNFAFASGVTGLLVDAGVNVGVKVGNCGKRVGVSLGDSGVKVSVMVGVSVGGSGVGEGGMGVGVSV